MYKRLGLVELKPTKMVIQLADCSIRVLKGIVDVLIKTREFYF